MAAEFNLKFQNYQEPSGEKNCFSLLAVSRKENQKNLNADIIEKIAI